MLVQVTRNPFKIETLTPLMRVYRFASEVKKWFPGIGKKWVKSTVGLAARVKMDKKIEFQVSVSTHDGFPAIKFLAYETNSQLHSIYFKRYQELYEPDIEACLELLIPTSRMFVDVGANWGYFVGKVALTQPNIELLAFEPMRTSYRDLSSLSQALTNSQIPIKIYQAALGESQTKASMTQPGFESGLASIAQTDGAQENSSLEVEVMTLNSFDIPPETVIKIDVEGFELQVLRGGIDRITKGKPTIIFEHWHETNQDLQPFRKLFNDLGYHVLRPHIERVEMPDQNLEQGNRISINLTLSAATELTVDRRYNLIAVHPSTHHFSLLASFMDPKKDLE
jgi:FkbM family methyltransferase